MLIVIDTTETFQYPLLRGAEWTYVADFVDREAATLVLPEIVIAETINHFPREVQKSLNEAQRATGRLRNFIPKLRTHVPDLKVAKETNDYRIALSERLRELQALTPEFDTIPLERIIQRSLDRRKPFDSNGQRGLRDAVLWESVLELVQNRKPETAVLVTGNTRDFGPHNGLAIELVEDLRIAGISPETVCVCEGVRKFVESYIKPTLNRLDELRNRIQNQTSELFDLLGFYAESCNDILTAISDEVAGWNFYELGDAVRFAFESPKLEYLDDSPDTFDVGEVYRIAHGNVAFDVEFVVKGRVACDELNSPGDGAFPWVSEFVGDVTFSVTMSIVMEEATGQVNEVAIDDIEIVPGVHWPRNHVD